jgi:methylenetetrahydrofolate dehydrogenase (NADP+)/methenyltetrahydrofolate cyclohydrolase
MTNEIKKELTGKEVAAAIMADALARSEKLAAAGHRPTLAVFRIGERPDDVFYEGSIKRHCERAAIDCRCTTLPADVAESEFAELLRSAATNPEIDGIFFFSPLPKTFDEPTLRELIPAAKDVDCLSKASAAAVFCGDESGFAPCTPSAVMEMLRYYQVPLAGKRAVVIGRSLVVGKPLAMLLLAANATVTICHSRTENLAAVCRDADVLLAAVGKARMVTADFVSENQTVIDVGVNADPENPGKMCGDVDYANVLPKVAACTPVPGGVGLVTTATLCRHVIEAAERAAK